MFKQNHESFHYLVTHCLSELNLFAVDESFRTPRGLALINSSFFKILVKLEKLTLLKSDDFHDAKGISLPSKGMQ